MIKFLIATTVAMMLLVSPVGAAGTGDRIMVDEGCQEEADALQLALIASTKGQAEAEAYFASENSCGFYRDPVPAIVLDGNVREFNGKVHLKVLRVRTPFHPELYVIEGLPPDVES